MKKNQETLKKNDITRQAVLYMAFELSNSKWKLAFSDGSKVRYVTIDARKLYQIQNEINKARKRFGLAALGSVRFL